MRNLYLGCASAALCTLLSACGGGGGGGVDYIPPAPLSEDAKHPKLVTTPTTENFDTQEYWASTSAKNSNVIPAWQAGATGHGIKIGLVDSGIDTNHHDFVGRIDPASRDFGAGSIMDTWGHGTALASIAAAAHDGRTNEGIAYEATLVVMNVSTANCRSDCTYSSRDIANGIEAAAAAGARVINLSIGGDRDDGVIDAVRSAAQRGIIFVVSAGNESAGQPTNFARSIADAAPGQTIIVGALGLAGPTADAYTGGGIDFSQRQPLSNMAGAQSGIFIGAPGQYIRVDYPGISDALEVVTGTSFAAPAVTGAVALMMQAFPSLSSAEIVQILLETGDDIGLTGVDSTFGHGRLNVGRAFQPIGQTTLAGAASVAVSLDDNGSAPAVIGDALDKGSLNAVILDAYRRAYSINLARTLHNSPSDRPLAAAMSAGIRSSSLDVGTANMDFQLTSGDVARRLGFAAQAVGPQFQRERLLGASMVATIGHGVTVGASSSGSSRSLLRSLSSAGARTFLVNQDVLASPGFARFGSRTVAVRKALGKWSVDARRETGDVAGMRLGEVKAHYRMTSAAIEANSDRAGLSIGMSRLLEDRTVLGGRLGAVFGHAGAKTTFLDGTARANFGQSWTVAGTMRRGWTSFSAGNLTTSGWALSLSKSGLFQPSDALTLMLSQPLKVDGGGFTFALPGAWDYAAGAATYSSSSMSLRPSGRELVAEVGLARQLRRGSAGFNLYARRQPGHYAAAAPDVGAALQLKIGLR